VHPTMLVLCLCAAGASGAEKLQVIERREIENGLVREKLLLPGWDPADPVPAIAIAPRGASKVPVVFVFHWFQGSKEAMEPWARELAAEGFFAVAPDLHLHGERRVAGMFARPDLPSLGEEFSVFVHQNSIAHSARDFPVMLESLAGRDDADIGRIGVTGISMGAGLALVLAWQDKRIAAAATLVGACDFWWDVTKLPPGPAQEEKKKGYGDRVRRLVESIDPWPRMDKLPPTALFMASGQRDHFIAIDSMRRFAAALRERYAQSPERFSFVEEDVGHEATESMRRQANAWIGRFVKSPAVSATPPPAANR
jgi:dienelactone hydrolase